MEADGVYLNKVYNWPMSSTKKISIYPFSIVRAKLFVSVYGIVMSQPHNNTYFQLVSVDNLQERVAKAEEEVFGYADGDFNDGSVDSADID